MGLFTNNSFNVCRQTSEPEYGKLNTLNSGHITDILIEQQHHLFPGSTSEYRDRRVATHGVDNKFLMTSRNIGPCVGRVINYHIYSQKFT